MVLKWLQQEEILCKLNISILMIIWITPFGKTSSVMQESNTVNKPIFKTNDTQRWVQYLSEHVRCFCNLPACVHTGYMCKSNGGGCFTDLWKVTGFPAGYRGRHGCLELLNNKERRCINMSDALKTPAKKRNMSKPYIHCCYQDMCNHVDSPQTRYLINSTLLGNNMKRENVRNQRTIGYSNSEVWFRAATIAVPICGAVILFVLVALAVKILRNERHNSHSRKLMGNPLYNSHISSEPRHCYKDHQSQQYEYLKKQYPRSHNPSYKPTTVDLLDYQHPLLVQKEFRGTNLHNENKNETNAKWNQLQCDPLHGIFYSAGKTLMCDIEKANSKCPNTNLDRNVNSQVEFSDIKYSDNKCDKTNTIL